MVAITQYQRELGILEWQRSEKGEKQVECSSIAGSEMEGRAGTWKLAVLGT